MNIIQLHSSIAQIPEGKKTYALNLNKGIHIPFKLFAADTFVLSKTPTTRRWKQVMATIFFKKAKIRRKGDANNSSLIRRQNSETALVGSSKHYFFCL